MKKFEELDACIQEIIKAAKDLVRHASDSGLAPEESLEVKEARCRVLTMAARLQTSLTTPTDLIRRLSIHNQLLSCIQWLGEFQVLACIPLGGSVAAKDVAELSGIPEDQLLRIVRMTATAGFLQEPQPGFLAHTTLSEPFVSKLIYLDAALFLAQTAAPAASMMSAATRRQGQDTALNLALGDTNETTFRSIRESRPKLQRQWLAHVQCEADIDECIVQVLAQLDWHNLVNAHVVDVAAESMAFAQALAERYPSVHFVLQTGGDQPLVQGQGKWKTPWRIDDIESRITWQKREPGGPQPVQSAAAYILNLAHKARSHASDRGLRTGLLKELRAHLPVLRQNGSVMVIVAPHLVPEPRSVHAEVEAAARRQDLLLFQLANEHEMEVGELMSLISSVRDETGRLVTIRQLQLSDGRVVALVTKYQPN